jgi:putative oxidoreductase
MKDIIDLIGRIFISSIFLYQAVVNITEAVSVKKEMIEYSVNRIDFLFATGIVLMILGGLSVLIGYRAKLGALLLLVFLVPSTLTYYFDFADEMQQQMFIRNIAIIGGLLMIVANGSGRYSIKRMLAGIK